MNATTPSRIATIDDLKLVARNIAQFLTPVLDRLKMVEQKAVSGGVQIHAHGQVDVGGLEKLAQVLSAPVVPQFDAKGKLVSAVRQLAAPADDVVAKLEKRIAELEARLPLGYGGVWGEGQQSNKGIFYTDHGSVWYCNATTRDRPGTSKSFTLACKRGQDAR